MKKKFINILIIIFLIIIILFIFNKLYKKNKYEKYSNLFSDINDIYISPIVINNFITENEAKYILLKSNNNFEESKVGLENQKVDLDTRISKICWLDKYDKSIEKIIKKMCYITNYSFENAEDLQVVKYEPNGFYRPHYDTCCEENCIDITKKQGGHRVVTTVIYLNDDFEGGSTKFPKLNINLKPPKYSAILFFSLDSQKNKCHPYSLHGGEPVISGEKYIANIWIREKNL